MAEVAEVAPLTISVAGPPLATTESDASAHPFDWRGMFPWAIVLGLGLWLLSFWTPRLKDWVASRREHHLASEEYAFQQLCRALKNNHPSEAHAALFVWLDRIAPGMSSREFTRHFGDERLEQLLDDLGAQHYRDARPVELTPLQQPLIRARESALRQGREHENVMLPPLNP